VDICVIGTGYVGIVAGTCFASVGNNVICVDNNPEKIASLKKGKVHIYEHGLENMIKDCVYEKRLSFTKNLSKAVRKSQVVFIAVPTPQSAGGSADLSNVFAVAKDIAKAANGCKVVVNKSTSPVGTCKEIEKILNANSKYKFDVVSNPEFLKQGSAVHDFLKPDRVVIGSDSKKAIGIMRQLYAPMVLNGNPVIVTDTLSAEMIKYACNAFLAVKISYINEIANICESVGADIDMVRKGMTSDPRIGGKFLYPGIGYGGSCFPKDVNALISVAKSNGYPAQMLVSANEINLAQRQRFIKKILKHFKGNISGRRFALWGLAFKPNTNDVREAPALTVINELLNAGAVVCAFDPKASGSAKAVLGNKIKYAKTPYDALKGADALLVITEWSEFKTPDFNTIKKLLKHPVIFDGRNQYDKEWLKNSGFAYYSVGRR
jgi:UDPglucose 6-dehydrogenase